MKSVEIKGLMFVQTHESDPLRYDVRDADFKRVAYVEWDGSQLVCSTSSDESKILYQTDVKEKYIEQCLGYVAAIINTRLNSVKPECAKVKKMKIKVWNISGYKGWDDYDGPFDDNINFNVAMDARFKKEEIEEIFFNRFSKKYRMVVVNAELVREVDID